MSPIVFYINVATSVMMVVSVVCTIFSGWDYVKSGKDILDPFA